MGFQLKNFASIAAAMINRAKATQTQLTDFAVGSVARTLIEAPAIEMEELYQRMFAGIMDAIPVAIYRGFQFEVKPPVKARGNLTLTFGAPIDGAFAVPPGTIFINRITGQRYVTTTGGTAATGATALTVVIDAENAGAAYNVGSGAVTAASNLILPPGTVLSNAALTTGSDGETDAERAGRFAEYIQSISRGTLTSVRYGASTAVVRDGSGAVVEFVTRVGLIETPGRVQVFIYGVNAVASLALVAAAQAITDGYFDTASGAFIPGYRALGIEVTIQPMVETAVDSAFTVSMRPGFPLDAARRAAIVDAVGVAVRSVPPGGVLYAGTLRNAALSVEGVAGVVIEQSTNIVCPQGSALVPGLITIGQAV